MEEGYGDDPAGSVDCGQENGGDGHGMEVPPAIVGSLGWMMEWELASLK